MPLGSCNLERSWLSGFTLLALRRRGMIILIPSSSPQSLLRTAASSFNLSRANFAPGSRPYRDRADDQPSGHSGKGTRGAISCGGEEAAERGRTEEEEKQVG